MSYRNRNKVIEDENIRRDSAIDTKASFDPINRGQPTKFNRKNWMGSILAAKLAEGGGNVSIPLKFPLKTDFDTDGIIGNATYNIPVDLDGYQGYILTLSGDVSLHLEQTASESKLYPLYFVIRQDSTGGHSIVGLDANIENATATQLDNVLNKDASAQTIFKLTNPSGSKWIIEKISLSGAQGAQGDQGIQGDQGDQGNQGPTGARGSQGNTGAQGSQGNAGATGSTGATGSAGAQGSQGNSGSDGTDATSSFSQAAIDGLEEITGAVALGIIEITHSVAEGITEITSAVALGITEITHSVALGITEITSAVALGITEITSAVALGITEITHAVALGITEITSAVALGITEITHAVALGITEITSAVALGITEITHNVALAIERVSVQVAEGIKRISVQVATGLFNLTSAVATAITNLTAAGINFLASASAAFGITPISGNTPGHFDLGTFDLKRVDRIFFDSNDAFDGNSAYPHITGGAKDMTFVVPDQHNFYWVDNDSTIGQLANLNKNRLKIREPLVIDNNGATVTLENGMVRKVGNDIVFRAEGQDFNASDIGSGSGGGTTEAFSANPPTGAFWIPVKDKPSTINVTTLESLVGTEDGSAAILRPATVTSTSASAILFCYKVYGQWFGTSFNSVISSTKTTTGKRSTNLPYTKKLAPILTGTGNTPNANSLPDVSGKWAVYGETDQSNDSKIVTKDNTILYYKDETAHYGASSSVDQGASDLPDTFPNRSAVTSNSTADTYFGLDDGYIGFDRGANRWVAKVGGYWFTMNLI